MAPLLSCERVSFAYRRSRVQALDQVDLALEPGEFAGIAGPTGAGKSTLVRAASGIVPQLYRGAFAGRVRVKGEDLAGRRVAELAGVVGTVFQDFEAQLFSTSVSRELAFGMENVGVAPEEMRARIAATAGLAGLDGLLDREPHSLSGGQKQRLALACVLCLEPELLLADEPTTDLDPMGKQDMSAALLRLAGQGRSIALVEHEAERLLPARRVHLMERGRIAASGPPRQVFADPDRCLRFGLFPPPLYALSARLGLSERPATLEEAAQLLHRNGLSAGPACRLPDEAGATGQPLLVVEDLHYAYGQGRPAVQGVSLEIRQGEAVALLGRNGSGKTTLAKHLNGLLRPRAGCVRCDGQRVDRLGPAAMSRRLGFVFQNPDHMLFAADARTEVAFGLEHAGVPATQIDRRAQQALESVGLGGRAAEDPFTMTRGDRQKLAVACVLACRPEVLVLDEPTTGLDAGEQLAMVELLQRHHRAGGTLVIITHSLDFAAACAGRAVVMEEGRVLADGPIRRIFGESELLARAGLVAPACARLGQRLGVPVLTADELASCLVRRPS